MNKLKLTILQKLKNNVIKLKSKIILVISEKK